MPGEAQRRDGALRRRRQRRASWHAPQPFWSLSGSAQSRSHSRPVSGTSVGRMRLRICSMRVSSGLSPPWQQKIFSSMTAAHGRQLKQSVKAFHSLIE